MNQLLSYCCAVAVVLASSAPVWAQDPRIRGGFASPQDEYRSRKLDVRSLVIIAGTPQGGAVAVSGEEYWIFSTAGGASPLTSREVAEYIADEEWLAAVENHETSRRRWLGIGLPVTFAGMGVGGLLVYNSLSTVEGTENEDDLFSDDDTTEINVGMMVAGSLLMASGVFLLPFIGVRGAQHGNRARVPMYTLDRSAGRARAERYNRALAEELGIPYEEPSSTEPSTPAPSTSPEREKPTVQWQVTPFALGARSVGFSMRF